MLVPDTYRNKILEQNLLLWSKILAGTAAAIAILVLIGWQADISFLKRPVSTPVAMNPATAIGFLLATLSLFISLSAQKHTYTGKALALIICLTGLLRLLTIFGLANIPIDTLLYSEKLKSEIINGAPNHMAPNTAFCFLLLGYILLTFKSSSLKQKTFALYVTVLLALLALLSVVGYVYNVKQFYGVFNYIPMAVHTAFSFMLLSVALLMTLPDVGFMKEFTSVLAGSTISRRVVPLAVLLPIALGFMRLLARWNNMLNTEFGDALLVLSIITVFIFLLWYNARHLNSQDLERRRTENKLKIVNQELESFSYSVAHDLRAPLRGVNGYAKILEEDYGHVLDDEAKRIIINIMRNASKMGQLIDDLLTFSRLSRKDLNKTDVPVKKMVTQVCNDLSQENPGRNIEFQIGELHNIHADSVALKQVWINLISNAVKYTRLRQAAVIEISSQTENGEVIYHVKDNGAGFDMQYVHKLFGVFQRLHAENDFEGTGVGLAIVQRIVLKHGGRIWAIGKEQEGADFFFALPIN
jgi:signal transduction histidine kinase